jgi:hypothetical protein
MGDDEQIEVGAPYAPLTEVAAAYGVSDDTIRWASNDPEQFGE